MAGAWPGTMLRPWVGIARQLTGEMPLAQNHIGWLYQNGWGVARDYVEAMDWYRKAADRGNALAQNHIGLLYQNGWGVPQDSAEAQVRMQKAAAAG